MLNDGHSLDKEPLDAVDRLLWERTARRDGDALCELFDRRAPAILGVLSRLLSRVEAEEILQEVFSDLWNETASSAAAGVSPFTWMLTRARVRATERITLIRQLSRASASGDSPRKTGGIRLADLQRAQPSSLSQ